MSLLFKYLRIHQIFGANTDVGKTILTSALVRASALKKNTVFYLKPVSAGSADSADDKHIRRHAGPATHHVHTKCLFRFGEPVSPHLAARMVEGGEAMIPSDETFVNSIAGYIRRCAAQSGFEQAHMYIETAGGVHSPTPSGTTQADSYRPLFLPTVLIGDARLGGISATIAAYESLVLRGYIVDAVLLFREAYYRNSEYLHPYFAERGIRVAAIPSPPVMLADSAANVVATEAYYDTLVPHSAPRDQEGDSGLRDRISDVVDHLDTCHTRRIEELASMPRRSLDTVWWPFVQHGLVQGEQDVTIIDSASSDFFSVHKPLSPNVTSAAATVSLLTPTFDGSASWWTQTLGHAHTALTLAAARASGRYGHVMFPQATHLPALKLAERLVHEGPGKGWAGRAFFSDNGSTGMEVALKMALRAFVKRREAVGEENIQETRERERLGVLGIKGSYHGDTIGVMDACEEAGVFTCEWHDAKGYWFEPPTVGVRDGEVVISVPASMFDATSAKTVPAKSLSWAYDIPARIDSDLATVYREYITRTLESLRHRAGVPRLAALVIEPLVMGAGGMIFVDPLFQRVLIDVVRIGGGGVGLPDVLPSRANEWRGLPVVFDEVFVGLHRLGMESAGPLLGVCPDVSVYAKILTGGLLPMAVTLASEAVFGAFLGAGKEEALLHGHSYTAHAVGCEVAGETMRIVDQLRESEEWKEARRRWEAGSAGEAGTVWSFWDPGFVESVSRLDVVEEVMTLGCVLAIRVRGDGGYVSHSARGVLQSLEAGGAGDVCSVAPGGAQYGVHFRTLGNVAYFMTSLNTGGAVVRSMEARIWQSLVDN